MIRLRHKLLIHALRGFDQLVLIATLFVLLEFSAKRAGSMHLQEMLQGSYGLRDTAGTVGLMIGWLFIFNRFVRYETDRLKSFGSQLFDVVKATAAAAFYLLIISAAFRFRRVNTEVIAILWCVSTGVGIMVRLLVRWMLMVARRSGHSYRHLLILGTSDQAVSIARRVDSNPVLGYKIAGLIAESDVEAAAAASRIAGYPVIGSLGNLKAILESRPVDEMIVCLPAAEYFAQLCEAVRLSEQLGIVVRVFPNPDDGQVFRRFHLERFDGDYVITLFREQMLFQLFLKRLIDFFGAVVLLTILSPLLLTIALVIKLTSPGPILFVQERVGMNKRRFRLYKFRSMHIDAEKRRRELEHLNEMDGPVFKIKNDPRITPIGRFIRKTSIDELPQLVNVLRGQMSLVGPRPPIPQEVDQYEWLYRKRLSIKPGITCLWQVSGRNHISFQQWMALDRQYIEHWSIWLDVQILLKTVPTVLFGKGAS